MKVIDAGALQKFVDQYFKGDLFVEALIQGSITGKQAKEAMDIVVKAIAVHRSVPSPIYFSHTSLPVASSYLYTV